MQAVGHTGDLFGVGEPAHERLVRLSYAMEPDVRDTLVRFDRVPGARVLAYGCGPPGALLPLSDAVGPTGTVVGVDRSGEALRTARALLAARGVANVRLVQAAINALALGVVCAAGPFDLAYGHAVLCDQRDVVGALRRIAATVRPGGHSVTQEAVMTAPIPVEAPDRFGRAANLLIPGGGTGGLFTVAATLGGVTGSAQEGCPLG